MACKEKSEPEAISTFLGLLSSAKRFFLDLHDLPYNVLFNCYNTYWNLKVECVRTMRERYEKRGHDYIVYVYTAPRGVDPKSNQHWKASQAMSVVVTVFPKSYSNRGRKGTTLMLLCWQSLLLGCYFDLDLF
ncbi:hypothetical protein GmHk_08G022978 [Glycine max]|nr:hypothetical protein GmHk_08G022978 [Glycine max]